MKKRNINLISGILCLALLVSVCGFTVAFFTDRTNHRMTITTASFTQDGYTLTREAPTGPFIAGEDVVAKIKESNKKDSDVISVITMSATWSSPDSSLSIFGNADPADNATLSIGGTPIASEKIAVSSDKKTITFDLPAHLLPSGAVNQTRDLVLHIPDRFVSTGSISFTFDKVIVFDGVPNAGFYFEADREDLNAAEELDFSVRVGWAASLSGTQNGKTLMGYLTNKDASGNYGIQYQLEFNYTQSAMKDFSSKTDAKWAYYKSTVNRLTFVSGMTTIGDYAFPDFEKVTAVTLPETITGVGSWAFDNTSIKELTVPASVGSLESMSFGHINELTEITFNSTASKNIAFPEKAGSITGAFYVYPYVDTIINGVNEDALAYDWIKDLRNPPTLAPSNSWIESDSIGAFSNPITSVKFVTRYTPSGNETEVWNAAVDRNGDGSNDDDIICYLNDTELTFYANTATRIYANEDSSSAFYGFTQTTGYDNIEMLDTRKTTDMSSMFSDNYSVTDLEVGHFDTSNVTNISGMFYICYDLPELDVSTWDTGNVTNMARVFSDCLSLTTLSGIQNWDTRNVRSTASMFDGVSSLTKLDLSSKRVTINGREYDSWHTKSLTNMSSMFGNTDDREHALQELNISTFDTRNVTTLKLTFDRCFSLASLDVTPRKITLNGDTFYTWDTGKVEIMYGTFSNCESLKSLDLSGWDTSAIGTGSNTSIDDFYQMFFGCYTLETLDVSRKSMNNINGRSFVSWDTSNAQYMESMFDDCNALRNLNLSNWNNALVENMDYMFYNCNSLTTLNLTGFTTPNLTSASCLFYNCKNLQSVDLSSFDTTQLKDMYGMFQNCSSLTTLDLSTIVTTGIKYSRYFACFAHGCTSLTSIILNEDFGQSSTLPSPGSSNGLFYTPSNLAITVIGANSVMKAYGWSSDNRTATLLDSNAFMSLASNGAAVTGYTTSLK